MPRFAFVAAFALAATAALSAQPARHAAVGVDLAGIDKAARPGDGFDQYANGGWRQATEIPADRASIGAFLTAALLVEQRNVEIITGAGRGNPAPGSNARKIADFYAAYLDRAAIDARGAAPLQAQLARIEAIADRRALAAALGANLRADVDPLNATPSAPRICSACSSLRGSRSPIATSPICSRAASACRSATITSPTRRR